MKAFRVFLKHGGSFVVKAEGIVLAGPEPKNVHEQNRWPAPDELGHDDRIVGLTPDPSFTLGRGAPIHPVSGVAFRGFYQPESDALWIDGTEVVAVVLELEQS